MKYLLSIGLYLFSLSYSQAQSKKWTLQECVTYAIENNLSIQQALLDIDDASLDKESAFGNFLPTANGSASHVWNSGLSTDITTNSLVNQTTMSTSFGATLGVNVFNGQINRFTLQRAELSKIASQFQLEDMKDNTSLLVANSFLQILFNIESLKVLQSQFEVTKQDVARTKELIESGILPQGDVLEIEATLASQEQQIVDAENNIRFTKISLAQLLLITDYENFDISTESYEVPTSDVMSLSAHAIYEKAVETRNGVKISQANMDLAEKDLAIARGGYFPTLSAFYNYNNRALKGDFTTESIFKQFQRNYGHTFGFQLSVPIFNGFSTKISTERSMLNVQRSQLNLEQTKIDLKTSVNQAYNDAKGALKAFHAAEKTEIARQAAFDYAQERHEVGVINSFEFQQTKQLLESAESQVIRAKYDFIFKLKILEFYFGVPLGEL